VACAKPTAGTLSTIATHPIEKKAENAVIQIEKVQSSDKSVSENFLGSNIFNDASSKVF